MRKHCSKVYKLRPCLHTESTNLGTHAHHRDRSAAAAISANGTYFLDNPRICALQKIRWTGKGTVITNNYVNFI